MLSYEDIIQQTRHSVGNPNMPLNSPPVKQESTVVEQPGNGRSENRAVQPPQAANTTGTLPISENPVVDMPTHTQAVKADGSIIQAASAPAYDPKSPYIDSFMSIEKPQAPDAKKGARNQTVAAIADGVATLAEMFAASKGARVRPRNQSASMAVAQNQKEERTRYEQKLENYDYRRMQALLQDKLYNQQQQQRNEDIARQERYTQEGREYNAQQTQEGRKWQEQQQEKAKTQGLEDYKAKVDYQTEAEIKRTKATYPYRSTRTTTSDKPQKREFTAAEKLEMRGKVESLSKEQQKKLGILKQTKTKDMYGNETVSEELDWDAVNKLDPEILAEVTGYNKQPATQRPTSTTQQSSTGRVRTTTKGKVR